uniref:PGG domain-containing protein n=1 Tax=Gongylonema pulchrum TaxID=637853 RepID=A0A183EJF8_9BILA
MTFGWLVDGVFRKVDERGRSIKDFFQEEIANNHDYSSLARATLPGLMEYARDVLLDFRMIAMLVLMAIAAITGIKTSNPFFLNTVALNDPDIIGLNMPAITGVGDAHSLAKLFSLATDGTLLSNRTLSQMKVPTIANWHIEQVLLYPIMKGRGFLFENHPTKHMKVPTIANWHIEQVLLYPIMKGRGFLFEKHPTKHLTLWDATHR